MLERYKMSIVFRAKMKTAVSEKQIRNVGGVLPTSEHEELNFGSGGREQQYKEKHAIRPENKCHSLV